jgi:hypothetical protein
MESFELVVYFTAFVASVSLLILLDLSSDNAKLTRKLELIEYEIVDKINFHASNFKKRIDSLERRLIQINGTVINIKKEVGVIKNPNPTVVTTAE